MADEEKELFLVPQKITNGNKTFWGMNHLNGNLLCTIDCETTGLDSEDNGIIEIAIVPLNGNIEPHEKFTLFHMRMKPEEHEPIDPDALRVTKTDLAALMLEGFERETVADYLSRWFEDLRLVPGKKIIPLGCNWPFDREFMKKWLGRETFEHIFDPRYRDIQTAACYLADCADMRCEPVPFPKVHLKYLCSQLKIPQYMAHSALNDALTTAQVYRRLMSMRPGFLA